MQGLHMFPSICIHSLLRKSLDNAGCMRRASGFMELIILGMKFSRNRGSISIGVRYWKPEGCQWGERFLIRLKVEVC